MATEPFPSTSKYCPRSRLARTSLGATRMEDREFAPVGFFDLQELLDDAWIEFTATSPVGIDLVAEASLRSLIAARLMRAAKTGETDRTALKALALRGL